MILLHILYLTQFHCLPWPSPKNKDENVHSFVLSGELFWEGGGEREKEQQVINKIKIHIWYLTQFHCLPWPSPKNKYENVHRFALGWETFLGRGEGRKEGERE